jgi:poly [ADP-ribose] polymerase
MATLVEKQKFILVSIEKNSNKFWDVTLYDNDDVLCQWGRVGYGSGSQEKTFSGVGRSFIEKKIGEKEAKGYKKIDTIDTVENNSQTSCVRVRGNDNLSKIAKSQIKFSSPVVERLVEYLTRKNAHNIYTATSGQVTYNTSNGLFQTPRGLVTRETVDSARKLLVKIGDFVKKKDYEGNKPREIVEQYMTYIPMNIGMGKFQFSSVFPDQISVNQQNIILDSLESSLDNVTNTPVVKNTAEAASAKEAPKVFDVILEVVEDKNEIKRIKNKYNSTRKSEHSSSRFEIKVIYRVIINNVKYAFEESGKKVGNLMELYHGTQTQNCLSILKSGLRKSPPSTAYICGKLFGNGIYFAINSSKSLNYSTSFWGGSNSDRTFMFMADVALGKFYVPYYQESKLPSGYDSFWAKPGKSGIQNDEIIVFKENQFNLTYLLEF